MVKVAAVQLDCSGELEETKKRVSSMVEEAANQGARIVCLPEHWLPAEKPDLADLLPFLKDIAKNVEIGILAGADFVRENNNISVQCILISSDASILGRQRKVHLFGREKMLAEAGSSYEIFEMEGVKIGVAICHDLVYPEVARILALKGAEIIFSPAKIVHDGLEPWHLYLKARALENRIPIVSPNCCGTSLFRGGSLIVGLRSDDNGIVYPQVLAEAADDESVLVAEVDVESIRPMRQERLAARRVDTYSWLLHEER